VYRHKTKEAGMDVYVDDFELVATAEDTPNNWAALEKEIDFKEPYHLWGVSPTAHLGCDYSVKREKIGQETIMTITASMKDYHEDFVKKFEEKWNVTISPHQTPWLDAASSKRYEK
jgi:hypothetical protein